MQQIWDNQFYILRVHRLELPRNDVFLSLDFFISHKIVMQHFIWVHCVYGFLVYKKNIMRYNVSFFVHFKHKNADILIMTSE